jgi:hypothetical protein
MFIRSLTACVTIALSAFLSAGASADVHYALEVTTPAEPQSHIPSHWTVSYWIKGSRERVESSFAPGILKRVNITQTDVNREFEVDLAEKIYTVRHIATAGVEYFVPPSPIILALPAPASAETPSTGTSVIDFLVDEKGKETINDVDARHCIVTLHQKTTGCAQPDFETVKLELWVANAKTGRLDSPQRYAGLTASSDGQSAAGAAKPEAECVPVRTLTGDTAALRDIFSHAIIKEIVTVNGMQVMSLRLKEYSTVPLTATLFTVPPSYKMLSKREYEQRERDQLEARLLETTPDGGTKPAANVNDDTSSSPDVTPVNPAMNGPGQPGPAAAPDNGDDGDDMPNLPNPGAGVKDRVRPWLRL